MPRFLSLFYRRIIHTDRSESGGSEHIGVQLRFKAPRSVPDRFAPIGTETITGVAIRRFWCSPITGWNGLPPATRFSAGFDTAIQDGYGTGFGTVSAEKLLPFRTRFSATRGNHLRRPMKLEWLANFRARIKCSLFAIKLSSVMNSGSLCDGRPISRAQKRHHR